MEAHGGYSFCGLAALMFLKKGRLCNIDTLLKWAANRQMRVEGGFQVRFLFLRQLSHHIFDELVVTNDPYFQFAGTKSFDTHMYS